MQLESPPVSYTHGRGASPYAGVASTSESFGSLPTLVCGLSISTTSSNRLSTGEGDRELLAREGDPEDEPVRSITVTCDGPACKAEELGGELVELVLAARVAEG